MIVLSPAYIDPGTGSMLFSIVTGFAVALYFVAKSAWIRIKTLFAGRGARLGAARGRREDIVIYSEGKRYWNVFLPVVEELERRGASAAFYTSEEDDPVFGMELKCVKPQYIGSGNAAYARLNILEAGVCLMTTPGLDVYQLKRSKLVGHYSHILHSPDDASLYRLFGLDYFDSVLLSGGYQAEAIRELEAKRGLKPKELPVVGLTYLDVYASKLKELPKKDEGAATVLVSPSWGKSSLLSLYGKSLLVPLAESGLKVILRPHPQSAISEAAMLKELSSSLAGFANVEWDFSRENLSALSRADLMISDYSGIVFDYAFLFGRPLLYANREFDMRPYDAADVSGPKWRFETLAKIGKELIPSDFPRIGELVVSMKADASLGRVIDAARDEAWQHRGESGKRVVDYLEKRAKA
jgi:hypothetical protein